MKKGWLIAIAIVALLGAWLMGQYNGLVTANERVNGSWAQVETQLQRRNDLIPNLVNTVKGYATHEQEVFKNVSDARAKMAGAQSVDEIAAADGELTQALGRLFAIVENYPQLKADQNFRALQDELAGTENRIATSRRDYNGEVQSFNARIRQFPTNIVAGMLGFSSRDYFRSAEGADQAPTVTF
ncbi:MAG: LemA family protein [Veillonellaceae bacterium]|nr:LemA family protein [Veillonellaceae bacterium]